MNARNDKLQRLAHIARLYYLEDKKQSEIAGEMGVSRPLISRMLQEARDLGIVEIHIHDPNERGNAILGRLRTVFSLSGGILVEDQGDDSEINRCLSDGILRLLQNLGSKRVGVGWGHLTGALVSYCDSGKNHSKLAIEHICPMIGNANVAIRNYHTNENVRILAERVGAKPHFLYLPAFVETREERDILFSTDLYQQVYHEWELMDTALVNIGNYPTSPDFASVARYGDKLQKQKACGRLIAYYYDENGRIIESDRDFSIQIPLSLLARCRNVVGLCSANTSEKALRGALRTGLFTHLIAREALVQSILDQK